MSITETKKRFLEAMPVLSFILFAFSGFYLIITAHKIGVITVLLGVCSYFMTKQAILKFFTTHGIQYSG
ncbi:hypothetical protein HOK51_02935 [Candidatus Woesearchaeota archaeon]|jgi:hypothetical protein|nr:hypothetical protein [Candidatus Woesearchaeota archaeon]MBT6518773.1 hypothetical protein [Candidatus Woesearchaeota archaeon]MBT7366877.1 hypothetical protein [Candidatus Woesearchaeota archaeon]